MKFIRNFRHRVSGLKGMRRGISSTDIQQERKCILSGSSDFYVREAYKTLRTNVTFSLAVEGCKVIAVTSAMASEGKSITVLNLAISFAEAGERVLLIDCDLRRPNQARLLNMRPKPGISNMLVKHLDMNTVIKESGYSKLDVILSGDIPPNPSELLGSGGMVGALDELRQRYDYIFIDTPPVDVVADASVLSKYVDGVLFVVRQGKSEKGSLLSAVGQLEFANAKLLGFVLNGVTADGLGHYGYGKYQRSKYQRYIREGSSASPPSSWGKTEEGNGGES